MQIKIFKENEVFLRLKPDDAGVHMELREHFSFRPDGYQFSPRYKNKLWDGRIYLYDIRTGRLPIGLLVDLFRFCQSRGYQPKFDQTKEQLGIFPTQLTPDDFAILNNIPFCYNELRDYQLKSVEAGITTKRLIIKSPTGSGKSAAIYYLTSWFYQKYQKPVLIIVPTISLVEQMASDFDQYSSLPMSSSMIYKIHSGQSRIGIQYEKTPIIISTWQSLLQLVPNKRSKYGASESFLADIGMCILDECHLGEGATITKILERCTGASYRIGLTGTLQESKMNISQLKGLFGPVFNAVETHTLQKRKELADLSIQCVVLKHPVEVKTALKKVATTSSKLTYQNEIDFLIGLEQRNQIISKLALAMTGNCLILFRYVENHGKRLFNTLTSLNTDLSRKIIFLSGESKLEEREGARQLIESEQNMIICGSLGILSTGVNLVNLNSIIFASPIKSQIKVIQSIGRVLRVSNRKKTATLIDIIDDLSLSKTKPNYAMQHGVLRMQYYANERFNFKTEELNYNYESRM